MSTKEDLSEWKIAPTKKMVAYGFGYVVVNYLLNNGFARVFYYYEVELGLPVMLLGIAYAIFALWNMINDPLLGYLTDKPRKWTKKWGLRAPWVIITAGPMLFLYMLIWTAPIGDVFLLFLYFVVITCVFDLFFSIFNDHVYGGFTNQFPSEYERRKSFSIATLIMGATITLMGVISAIVIEYGNPQSFIVNAMIMLVFLIIFTLIQFTGIRESKEMKEMFIEKDKTTEKKSFIEATKVALNNKNFVVSLIGYTISTTAMQLSNANAIYVFKDIYGLPYSMSIFTQLAGMIGFLIIIPFWYGYSRKNGFKKTYWVCFILHGIAIIPGLFITDIISATIFQFIGALFYSGEVIMLMPVAADTYDSVAIDMGKRQDGMFVGLRNFFFRIAFLVQGVVFTVVSITTGYVATEELVAQSAIATFGIRIQGSLIPLILYIIMGLIFRKYYDLEGDKKAEMIKNLKEAGLYRT